MGSGSTTGVIPSNGAWGYSTQTPETFDFSTLTPNLSSVVPGGTYARQSTLSLTPQDFGAYGDAKRSTACTFTAGSALITVEPGGPFFTPDVGSVGADGVPWLAAVVGAGPTPGQTPTANSTLITGITYVSPTTALLSVAASASGTNFAFWGHDDTAALLAWAVAISARAQWRPNGTTSPSPLGQLGRIRGMYLTTQGIAFGDGNSRLDGGSIDWGNRVTTEIVYCGPSCDALNTAGGTFPNDNPGEYILRFRSWRSMVFRSSCSLITPNGDIHVRAAFWLSAEKGGGKMIVNDFLVNNCLSAFVVGSGITIPAGQTWWDPGVNPTKPTGQMNSVQFNNCEANNAGILFDLLGVNTECCEFNFCSPNTLKAVRCWNGRAWTWHKSDETITAPNFDLGPNSDPNFWYFADMHGGSSGDGGPVISDVRMEHCPNVLRIMSDADNAVLAALVAPSPKISGFVTPSVVAPAYTVTVSMTAGSEIATVTGAGTIDNRAGHKVMTVPGAGPGGADLVARIITFLTGGNGVGFARLHAVAQTPVTNVTATVSGLDNPTPLFDLSMNGQLTIEESNLQQPGGYILIRNGTSTTKTGVAVSRSRLPNTVTDDPQTLLRVHALANSTTSGVDFDFKQLFTADGTTRIADVRGFISNTDARTVATTIAAGSNGVSLPTATINVASTAGVDTTKPLLIRTSLGVFLISCTGTAGGNQLTGCTGGRGVMSTGGEVLQGKWTGGRDRGFVTGAPAIAGIAGDICHRVDTPTTANQRLYICTVTGAAGAATWVGIA